MRSMSCGFTPEGQAAGPIVRRPIEGISTANVDDLEVCFCSMLSVRVKRYILL
jgi:hypothetical protein